MKTLSQVFFAGVGSDKRGVSEAPPLIRCPSTRARIPLLRPTSSPRVRRCSPSPAALRARALYRCQRDEFTPDFRGCDARQRQPHHRGDRHRPCRKHAPRDQGHTRASYSTWVRTGSLIDHACLDAKLLCVHAGGMSRCTRGRCRRCRAPRRGCCPASGPPRRRCRSRRARRRPWARCRGSRMRGSAAAPQSRASRTTGTKRRGGHPRDGSYPPSTSRT